MRSLPIASRTFLTADYAGITCHFRVRVARCVCRAGRASDRCCLEIWRCTSSRVDVGDENEADWEELGPSDIQTRTRV
jgi:hypothetical protein